MRLPPSILIGLLAVASAASAAEPVPPTPPLVLTPAECQVWARELSFARSVAEHDATGFAKHLHPQAAFGVSRVEPTRSAAAIAKRWAGIVKGEGIRLQWYPTRVTIAGRPDVAWSSGPSLVEDLTPGASPRYSLGGFQSVWVRDKAGSWRVLFDDGTEQKPVTEVEVAAFHAARRPACPRG